MRLPKNNCVVSFSFPGFDLLNIGTMGVFCQQKSTRSIVYSACDCVSTWWLSCANILVTCMLTANKQETKRTGNGDVPNSHWLVDTEGWPRFFPEKSQSGERYHEWYPFQAANLCSDGHPWAVCKIPPFCLIQSSWASRGCQLVMGVALYSYSYHLHFERWDFRKNHPAIPGYPSRVNIRLRRPVTAGSIHPVVGLRKMSMIFFSSSFFGSSLPLCPMLEKLEYKSSRWFRHSPASRILMFVELLDLCWLLGHQIVSETSVFAGASHQT